VRWSRLLWVESSFVLSTRALGFATPEKAKNSIALLSSTRPGLPATMSANNHMHVEQPARGQTRCKGSSGGQIGMHRRHPYKLEGGGDKIQVGVCLNHLLHSSTIWHTCDHRHSIFSQHLTSCNQTHATLLHIAHAALLPTKPTHNDAANPGPH
jgi:hypothetical protein